MIKPVNYYWENWIHAVVTRQSCNGVQINVDDGLARTETEINPYSNPPKTDVPRFLGAANVNALTGKFKGTLDQLHVWEPVMNDEEALNLYNGDAGLD